MAKGLDYSWGRPDLDEVKQQGYGFVARYASLTTKGITKAEANDIHAHGLGIVLVYEGYAGRAKEGRIAGYADGRTALANARVIGFPDSRPIYFAVDFNAVPADQFAIDGYLRGAAAVIGASRVGVYGSYYVVERCWKNGSARWFWQTYAWSTGLVSFHTHFLQYLNGQKVGGADVDLNESKQADFGAWEVPPKPFAAPAPKPAKHIMTGAELLAMVRRMLIK
jgi:hypothetical protein